MEPSSSAAAVLGLRHVLEDGLAVLEGRLTDSDRQHFVIQDLAGLLRRAARGVQMTEGRQLFVHVHAGDVSAFEAYSLIFRYLSETYQNTLSARIGGTSATLSKLAQHEHIPPAERRAASDFFTQLLARLNHDETYSQQREPEIIGSH